MNNKNKTAPAIAPVYSDCISYVAPEDLASVPDDYRHSDDKKDGHSPARRVSIEEADRFGKELWENE